MFTLRLDEEAAKAIDDSDGTVSVDKALKSLAPQIAQAVANVMSMEDLADALPELVEDSDGEEDADSVTVDAYPMTGTVSASTGQDGKGQDGEAASSDTAEGEVKVKAPKKTPLSNGWKSTPAGDVVLGTCAAASWGHY